VRATFAAARLQNGRPGPEAAGQLCQHGLRLMGHVARFLGRFHMRATFAAALLQNDRPMPRPAGQLCQHGLHLMGHISIAPWAGLRYQMGQLMGQLHAVSRVLFLLSI